MHMYFILFSEILFIQQVVLESNSLRLSFLYLKSKKEKVEAYKDYA